MTARKVLLWEDDSEEEETEEEVVEDKKLPGNSVVEISDSEDENVFQSKKITKTTGGGKREDKTMVRFAPGTVDKVRLNDTPRAKPKPKQLEEMMIIDVEECDDTPQTPSKAKPAVNEKREADKSRSQPRFKPAIIPDDKLPASSKFKPAIIPDDKPPAQQKKSTCEPNKRNEQPQPKVQGSGSKPAKPLERKIREAIELRTMGDYKGKSPAAGNTRQHRPAGQDASTDLVRTPTLPLPVSVADQPASREWSAPWFATETDFRFARFLIKNSAKPVQTLYDELDEFSERFDTAFNFITDNKLSKPGGVNEPTRTSNRSINQRAVFSLGEVRRQLIKVFNAVISVVHSTDTPTPNVLTKLYEYNNVLVIQTVECRESGQRVSTLISGDIENLSFLSFLIRAHAGEHIESLRDKVFLPHVHQDLRETWYPEVLYDDKLRQRILNAALSKSSSGFSSYVMVPIVEMRLDRTKIYTEKSSNKGFDFVMDVVPLEYNDYLEGYLGLERKPEEEKKEKE